MSEPQIDFVPYPEVDDPDFYKTIYRKKEFYKTKVPKDYLEQNPEKACDPDQFSLQSYQEFLRNYMSSSTHYNGLLAFWGVGTGKTCAAIQVAEGLKDIVKKLGRKIYIIAKEQIRPNFRKEIYSMAREKEEIAKRAIPGSMQCTGTNYYISRSEEKDDEKRARKIKSNYSEYYEFYGMGSFANYVDTVVAKTHSNLGDFFSNSVIIIDEAHGLTGDAKHKTEAKKPKDKLKGNLTGEKAVKKPKDISERGILTVLHEILKKSSGIKLLLLTATPMKDKGEELFDLLNLLLENDHRPLITKHELFPSEDTVNEQKLAELVRGYVSYVRGENPVTFPRVEYVTDEDLPSTALKPKTYIPTPPFDVDGHAMSEKQWIRHTTFVRCPMSNYQFSNYLRDLEKENKSKSKSKDGKDSEDKTVDLIGRQDSNIVFPTQNPLTANFGNIGFDQAFDEKPTESIVYKTMANGKELKTKSVMQYAYHSYNEGFLDESKLGQYSSKFKLYLDNVINSQGIIYTYTDFVKAGVLSLALILEANGYIRYQQQSKASANKLFIEDKKRKQRCAQCGRLRNDPNVTHLNKGGSSYDPSSIPQGGKIPPHKFEQATYVLFMGEEKISDEEMRVINSKENKYGLLIKAILGTRVSGEGIDYKRIREVHIIEPWHNNTRLYQVIGRAARHCSHKDLPYDERQVKVFKYVASAPQIYYDLYSKLPELQNQGLINNMVPGNLTIDSYLPNQTFAYTYKNLFTETSDERVYRRIERKELFVKKVERIMKMYAIDCRLNKVANVFPTDKDYSRECDYDVCNYECAGGVNTIDDSKMKVNLDTYTLYYSEPQIDRAQKAIHDIFRGNFVMDLPTIIKQVRLRSADMEETYIDEALDRILGHPPQRAPAGLVDRFGRQGHLIFSNPYYIFQPDDLDDNKAPLYYRSMPLTVKKQFLNLDILKSELAMSAPIPKSNTEVEEGGLGSNAVASQMAKVDELIQQLLSLNNKYKIEARLDRLPPPMQASVYEQVMFKSTYPQTFQDVLLNFFKKKANPELKDDAYWATVKVYGRMGPQSLTMEYLAHRINNEVRYFNYTPGQKFGKWITIPDNDPRIVAIRDSMSASASSVPVRPLSTFHGYLKYENKKGIFEFKTVDKSKEKQTQTKAKITKTGIEVKNNKKPMLKGHTCTQDSRPVLAGYALKLGVPDVPSNLTKEGICSLIELKLREKDDLDPDHKWFYVDQ